MNFKRMPEEPDKSLKIMTDDFQLVQVQPGCYTLSGSLDIHAASALRDSLLAMIQAEPAPQRLDLEGVTYCGTPALQLLESAHRSQPGLIIDPLSESMLQACRTLGMDPARFRTPRHEV